jgi:anaerobic selenocysteine-containing dehydrogenase
VKPAGKPDEIAPMTPLPGPPLGFVTAPHDLLVDADGRPCRIDKAYSWEAPFAAHGLMHTVIANAARGDPYPIDVLFLYMANMSWNSAMNVNTIADLTAEHPDGFHRFTHHLFDAYCSEMVAYADLVAGHVISSASTASARSADLKPRQPGRCDPPARGRAGS